MTHGSLFSGIGGFELGAQWAGIETLWNCEIEEHKRKILKRHFPHSFQYTDVCTLSGVPCVDIISGGFPCQDISIGNVSNKKIHKNGKIGINGERSGLWKECFATLPKSGMTVNGNVYMQPSLATTIEGKEFMLLPTPSKSDAYIILESSDQYKKYYQHGHQDKTLYQCQLNGLTPIQTINVYECMMGFPLNWTSEE